MQDEPDVNLPAAWRIDKFLDDYEDEKLDSLKGHKLEFVKVNVKSDAMAANFDDDYKVLPLEAWQGNSLYLLTLISHLALAFFPQLYNEEGISYSS